MSFLVSRCFLKVGATTAPNRANGRHRRGLPWVLAAAGLAGLLSACGGGERADPGPGRDGGSVALKPSQPGDLTAHVQRVLRERAAQRQSGRGLADAAGSVAPAPAGAAAPAPAFSTSLTQERDVDEPDLLKTDGSHLFSIDLHDPAKPLLRSTRRTPSGALEERAAVALALGGAASLAPRGLVLSADGRALAVASEGYAQTDNPCVDLCPPTILLPAPQWVRSLVTVQRFDLADAGAPAAGIPLVFDGRLVDARRVGDHVVLVSEHQPMLAADQLPLNTTPAEREAAIMATRGTDLLPRRRLADGSTPPMLGETDCWLQPANASLALVVTTITIVDLRAPDLAPVSRCFIGGTEALYMTPSTMVLASTRWAYQAVGGVLRYPETIRTDLHKFSFDGGRLAYRASGDVEGHLGWDVQRKSYRLSEHQGLLRVLTFTGPLGWANVGDAASTPPSPARLTVLREDMGAQGGVLTAVATLPNAQHPEPLGKPGEQVHGVRFTGARGYVVTFRQIDPLYVLDLADALNPRVAGVLEAPGFSDHLVPLSDALLLGVGKEADAAGRTGGVKVSLFDVGDATRPRELASQVFGQAGSQSGLDTSRQGLAMLGHGGTVRLSLPMLLYDANFSNPRDRLQRLEVDLAAGTLVAKAPLAPPAGPLPGALSTQRSMLIGEQVVWLHGGRLGSQAW